MCDYGYNNTHDIYMALVFKLPFPRGAAYRRLFVGHSEGEARIAQILKPSVTVYFLPDHVMWSFPQQSYKMMTLISTSTLRKASYKDPYPDEVGISNILHCNSMLRFNSFQ